MPARSADDKIGGQENKRVSLSIATALVIRSADGRREAGY
jgi:hypothetical protein